MHKGSLFIVFVILLGIGMLVFLSFGYEAPQTGNTESASRPPAVDCGSDMGCFRQALEDCNRTTFTLATPDNSSDYWEGEITGKVLSKCEVILFDPKTEKSMACTLDRNIISQIQSFETLNKVCEGSLLEDIS
jgi:hypothetical protein